MADTFYAWSNFEGGKEDVKVGDKVTQDMLGVSDEEWESFKESGVVRTTPYPEMGDFPGSPVELRKAQLAAEASDEGFFDSQYGRVNAGEEVNPDDVPKDPPPSSIGLGSR